MKKRFTNSLKTLLLFKINLMKKFLGLVALLLVMGCDDGDMSFDTFDFTDATAQKCADGNILYKINGSEVLILDIDPSNFVNAENLEGTIIQIGSANKVTYRNYSGIVSSSSGIICTDVPPASPTVIEEWIAVGGSIRIITSKLLDDEGNVNGYAHQITLVSVDFSNAEQNIIIQDNNFGTYNTTLGYTFDFTGTETNPVVVNSCINGNGLIYKKNGSEALIINIPPTDFPTTEGSTDITLNETNRRVIFDVYSGSPSIDNICGSVIPPVTPVIEQRWNAEGTLHIETTISDGQPVHDITLNVTFINSANGQETFEKMDYNFGVYPPQ